MGETFRRFFFKFLGLSWALPCSIKSKHSLMHWLYWPLCDWHSRNGHSCPHADRLHYLHADDWPTVFFCSFPSRRPDVLMHKRWKDTQSWMGSASSKFIRAQSTYGGCGCSMRVVYLNFQNYFTSYSFVLFMGYE